MTSRLEYQMLLLLARPGSDSDMQKIKIAALFRAAKRSEGYFSNMIIYQRNSYHALTLIPREFYTLDNYVLSSMDSARRVIFFINLRLS